MKIINNTHWQTAPLARIARRVLTLETTGRPERRVRRRRLVLTVGYNRSGPISDGTCSGWAPYGGTHFHVNVPSGHVDPVDFAHVVGHELGHIWGLHHREMRPILHYSRGGPSNLRYAWATSIGIAKQSTKKVRPTHDDKLTHALTMQRRAETRAKRASTILKKWQRRVRTLERQLQIAATTVSQAT